MITLKNYLETEHIFKQNHIFPDCISNASAELKTGKSSMNCSTGAAEEKKSPRQDLLIPDWVAWYVPSV